MAKKLTSKKARQILHDKSVHGKPLTDKQRKFFGAVASGYIKAQGGEQVPSEQQWLTNKFYEGITYPPGMQYPSRIQDPERRNQQMKDVFFTLMDQYKNPNMAEDAMRAQNWNYGSDRLEHQKLQDYYGYDYNDIQPENLQSYYQDYMEKATPFLEEQKNEGWLDKYEDGGAESRMGGLTDIPFRYNGAWGGPSMQYGGNIQPPMAGADQTVPMYQMGGSLPGVGGFMYARTHNPAPSEGPYAKKTMPSAQNGQEMSYYQHGLDWKPRNISQDGKEVKRYPWEISAKDLTNYSSDAAAANIRNQDAEAYQQKRRMIGAAKETYVGPARTPGTEDEQLRAYRNRAYQAENAPYTRIDEQSNLSRAIPNVSMSGQPDVRTPEARWQKGAEHMMNAMEVAGAMQGLGYLGRQGYNAARAALAESMESGILSKTYKLNPWAVKENPEMFLYRARPVGQDINMNMAAQLRAKQAAGKPLTWYQKNLLNPQTNPELLAREKYYGQWFEKDPSRLDFYINPGTRNFADNDAIEILRTKLPKSEAAKLNISQFPDAKLLSASPETEFILPKGMIESAERFPESSLQQLIQEDKAFNTPHWLRGYPKPAIIKNKGEYIKVPKQKQGGVVKDDMGYWNPDNRGKVVEIDSPDITMEGVYEPLLGISNTGDTKLMTPGNNYKFKGSKVREYPMAQTGTRIYTDYDAYKEAMTRYADSADAYLAGQRLLAPLLKKKFKIDTSGSKDLSENIKDPKTGKKVPVSKINKGYYNILDKSKVSLSFSNVKPTKFVQLTRSSSDRPFFGDEYSSMFSFGTDYRFVPQYDHPQSIVFQPKKEEERIIPKQIIKKPKPKEKPKEKVKPTKFEKQKIETRPSLKLIDRELERPELAPVKNLPYRVEYRLPSGEQTSAYFEDEPSSREFWKSTPGEKTGYYENPPKKKSGGWLDKYE